MSLMALLAMAGGQDSVNPATITVHAGRVIGHVTRWMTGACLEDVNHEVYGGIYSQMIFGESFQEPAPPAKITGFSRFGGDWHVVDGELRVSGSDGPKLVSTDAPHVDSTVEVDIFLPAASNGVAGLILQVSDPGIGADRFRGYEVALGDGFLRLGRHRNNWEHIGDYRCNSAPGRWMKLKVRAADPRLEISLDGRKIVDYVDRDNPLPPGAFGLRTWQRDARFRNVVVWTGASGEVRAFQEQPDQLQDVSGMWRPTSRPLSGSRYELTADQPFVGRQSQRIIHFVQGEYAGLENRGLNRQGMAFVAGKPYEGKLAVRAPKPIEVWLSIESVDGARTYAESHARVMSRDWQIVDLKLTPRESDRAGRFVIRVKDVGSVDVGYVSLQPGAWGRFKGLPVRGDVVRALIDQGITVLRYGGSMVNADEYRWKKMIGPREKRPPYKGTWYLYSTNGWGIPDFLNLCEAAGFLAVPAFNMDETPRDMADFVEYANGPADSEWGRRRAADGHPKPYGLRYLELGNEEAVDEAYWRRFEPLATAIWAKDRNITIVVGDFAYDKPIADPNNFDGAPRIRSLAAHKKILDLAKAHNRAVWFDVHVWNDTELQPETLGGIPTFIDWLGKLSPGADFKVVVFELNANNHAVRRAIAYSHAINQLERLGDRIPIVCSANCLQVDGQNDNGWDQGLLFLNPWKVWPQPPYFVTQMLSRPYLPCVVAAECSNHALDVTAKTSADGKTLQIQVVNMDASPITADIRLDGLALDRGPVYSYEIFGGLDSVNSAEHPDRISGMSKLLLKGFENRSARWTFPAHSYSVLRLGGVARRQ